MRSPTRRRLLQITAGLAALGAGPAIPRHLHHRWTGSALGAGATLDLYHTDRVRASRLVTQVVAEVDRLESIFSLQRQTSSLSRLNRDGRLTRPPLELVTVLEAAAMFSGLSGGAFDVTVQPLWRLFADAAAPGATPCDRAIADALALVGWRRVGLDRASLGFGRTGMAATLNGIAQGYITDRITDLLRDAGVADVLVDLGELRAMGTPPRGRFWHVATAMGEVRLGSGGLAVSAAQTADCCLAAGSPNLLSPLTGRPVLDGRIVVVMAPSALLADAASTALAASEPTAIGPLTARLAPLGIAVANNTILFEKSQPML